MWLFKFPCLDSRLSFQVSLLTYFIFFQRGFFCYCCCSRIFSLLDFSYVFHCLERFSSTRLTFILSLDPSWIFFSMCVCAQSRLTLQSLGLQPVKLFCSWDFPGKNTKVLYHFLLQASRSRDQTHVSCISRQILNHCTTSEAHSFLWVVFHQVLVTYHY